MSLGRNATYGFLSRLTPAIVTLVTVPFYIHIVGVERYGVLATAWLLLGYFGAFDLGLGRALEYRVAYIGRSNPEEQSCAMWSATAVVIVISLIAALLLYLGGMWYFSGPFNVSLGLKEEVLMAMPLIAIALPFALLGNLLNGGLNGQQCFGHTSLITALTAIGSQVLPLLVAIFWRHDLFALVLATFTMTLLRAALLLIRSLDLIGQGHRPRINRGEIRQMLGFGGWVTIAGLVNPALQVGDRATVGWLLNAQAVSIYTVPSQIAQRASILSIAISTAVFPRLTEMAAKKDDATELTKDVTRTTAALLTPMIILGIITMRPFLNIWLAGKLDPIAATIGEIALFGQWYASLAVTNMSLIQAQGKPRTFALLSLCELPFYFILLIGLTNHFGLVGTAMASLVRFAVDYALMTVFALRSWKAFLPYIFPSVLITSTIVIWDFSYATLLGTTVIFSLFTGSCIWAWRIMPEGGRQLLRGCVRTLT